MFREDISQPIHQEQKERPSPGSVAEKAEYQKNQDSEKMRRWRGWRAMMEEADSTFGEMFGYTRFQKALAQLAQEYGIEEYYADDAYIASIYYRTQLDDTYPDLSHDQKDIEAYLRGKEVLLALANRNGIHVYEEQQESGYQSFDTTLPSEKINVAYRQVEIARAKAVVLGLKDDVYLNIGDPFEWTNKNRNRVDADGNPVTYLVEYSPGDVSSFIGARNPQDMAHTDQLNRATDPDNEYDIWSNRGSMKAIKDYLLERKEDGHTFAAADAEWLMALDAPLQRASDLHQELSHQTHVGDYLTSDGLESGGRMKDLQELQALLAEITSINQERHTAWQAMGKDSKRPAYDTSGGLSPIDLLSHLIEVDIDNLRSVARGLEATMVEMPGLLHQWFEDLADAHMKFEQDRMTAEVDPYDLDVYTNKWVESVRKFVPDYHEGKKGDLAAYEGKMANILRDFFLSNGFSVIRNIDPDLFRKINTELTETILLKNPHTPKTDKAVLLEEVFPNTSLPDNCIDRATACWSVSRQAMTVMTDAERAEIFAEFDRILKPGGRATIYPMDYWSDQKNPHLSKEQIEQILEVYKRSTQSNLDYELKYAPGKFREHLVLILKKPS